MNQKESDNPEKNIDEATDEDLNEVSFEKKINLLENQIHLINSKLHEPDKKTWLAKNASLLLSIVALITSISFTIYGIQKENTKDEEQQKKAFELSKEEKQQRIEELTLKLTELAEKNTKLASENPNVNVNTLSVLINYQRLIYVNEIIELIEENDSGFPPDIYALIGNELKMDGQFKKALGFYHKELSHAKSATSKVVAYRDLGQVYGIRNTPIFEADSSSYYRILSIQYSDSIHGEQRLIYKGYSYQLWAADELYFGNSKLGLALLDSARLYYMNLPDNNNAKNYNLRMLSQMIEFEERKDLFKVFFKLAGEWTSSRNSDVDAKLHFYQNSNGWVCNLEVYELGIVTSNLGGIMISISNDHITFSLQGMQKMDIPGNPYNDRKSASSTLKITKYKDRDNILFVSLNEMNEQSKNFTIIKN